MEDLASLSDITRCYHTVIDEVFLLQQEAVLADQLPLARELLHWFKQLLEQHIAAEDELLFPAHQSLPAATRWQTSLYSHEHQKIRQLLTELERRFDQLSSSPSRRCRLALLDYQHTFKNVLQHHEEREEKGLLPELDSQLTVKEIDQLRLAINTRWPALADLQQRCAAYSRRLG